MSAFFSSAQQIHDTLQYHNPEFARMFRFVMGNESSEYDEYNATSIHYLINVKSPDAMNLSLQIDSRHVDHMDCLGQTPLIRALHSVDACPEDSEAIRRIVAVLLEHRANPDHRAGPEHPTPLMLAVLHGDPVIVRLLLDAGANPCLRLEAPGLFLKKGDTALSLAVRLHTLGLTNPACVEVQQMSILQQLLGCPRISPNTIFHAIQQTRTPFLKQYLLNFRTCLNADASLVV